MNRLRKRCRKIIPECSSSSSARRRLIMAFATGYDDIAFAKSSKDSQAPQTWTPQSSRRSLIMHLANVRGAATICDGFSKEAEAKWLAPMKPSALLPQPCVNPMQASSPQSPPPRAQPPQASPSQEPPPQAPPPQAPPPQTSALPLPHPTTLSPSSVQQSPPHTPPA